MIALILASTLAVAAPLLATADGDGWRVVGGYGAGALLKGALDRTLRGIAPAGEVFPHQPVG